MWSKHLPGGLVTSSGIHIDSSCPFWFTLELYWSLYFFVHRGFHIITVVMSKHYFSYTNPLEAIFSHVTVKKRQIGIRKLYIFRVKNRVFSYKIAYFNVFYPVYYLITYTIIVPKKQQNPSVHPSRDIFVPSLHHFR